MGAYNRPGVQAACLELQDRHGHCVSYLLWAAWCARAGRLPRGDDLTACADLSRSWEDQTLQPSRQRRRAATDPAEKARLADAALADEHRLLASLEARTPAAARPLTVAEGLIAAVQAWGSPAPEPLLAIIGAAFPER